MITGRVNLYEGLFLINQQVTTGDPTAGMQRIEQILQRVEAEVLALYKWDDRRLAYDIDGQYRGVYFRALFRLKGEQVAEIERRCDLAEEISRVMVTRADHVGDVEIEQAREEAKQTQAEAQMRSAGEGEAAGNAEPATSSSTAESGESRE